MTDLNIEGAKNYPIKWICNFRGQKAIGICGFSQKIAMFAHDVRVATLIKDIIISDNKNSEAFGCEEEDRCCDFDCKYCKITEEEYLKITENEPTKGAVLELKEGLNSLNEELKEKKLVPFEKYEIIKF